MAEDVRRRRAERARQDRMKNLIPEYKWYIVGAVLLLAVGGAAMTGVLNLGPSSGGLKFAHEHPSFTLFIDGEKVSFNHPDYDINRISDKVHMHIRGDEGTASTWHLEARFPNGEPDWTLKRLFETYGLIFTPGYLKLDTHDGHNGTEYRDSGNKTWKVYVSKLVAGTNAAGETENIRQPFEQVPGDYTAYVPRDMNKILITYGDLTAEQLQAQQAAVPDPRP